MSTRRDGDHSLSKPRVFACSTATDPDPGTSGVAANYLTQRETSSMSLFSAPVEVMDLA